MREELKESAEKTADERQTLTDKEEEITQLHDKIEQLDKVGILRISKSERFGILAFVLSNSLANLDYVCLGSNNNKHNNR